MKKFNIDFTEPKYGWIGISLSQSSSKRYSSSPLNKKTFMYISASGVFNPFYDYVDILYDLTFNRVKKSVLTIDQEGYDGVITFINKGKYIEIITETHRERNRNKYNLPLFRGTFSKRDLLNEMSLKLLKVYNKNSIEMDNDWYNFSFDKYKLRKIMSRLKKGS